MDEGADGSSAAAACVGVWLGQAGAVFGAAARCGCEDVHAASFVPNPFASGPRMHDYAIRAGGMGALAVPVAPGLLGVRAPVITTSHAVIGGSSMAASASASASVALSV